MNSLISIIIPVYNVENYLERCLDSVLGQTYPHLQVILVDDASQDKSGRICDAYEKKDARIQVLHLPHGGVSAARNKGLSMARGSYIGFVDGDDWCQEDMFEQLLKGLLESQAQAARCNYYKVKGKLYQPYIKKATGKLVSGKEAIVDSLYHKDDSGYGTVVWNTLFQADLVKTPSLISFNEKLEIGEDADWLYRVLDTCDKVVLLPQPLYNYNNNNEGSALRRAGNYNKKLYKSTVYKIRFLVQHGYSSKDINYLKRIAAGYAYFSQVAYYCESGRCDKRWLKTRHALANPHGGSALSRTKYMFIGYLIRLGLPRSLVRNLTNLKKS